MRVCVCVRACVRVCVCVCVCVCVVTDEVRQKRLLQRKIERKKNRRRRREPRLTKQQTQVQDKQFFLEKQTQNTVIVDSNEITKNTTASCHSHNAPEVVIPCRVDTVGLQVVSRAGYQGNKDWSTVCVLKRGSEAVSSCFVVS